MMSKIKQRDLLNEGFWDRFNPTPAIRQGVEAVKQIGSVVAPEIYDPIKKTFDKYRDMRKNIKRAGKSVTDVVIEEIMDSGYFPYEHKIKWHKDKLGKMVKNDDGTYTGYVTVGGIGYNEKGEPYMEVEYSNPLKRNVIFNYDPVARDIKIIVHPHRNLSVRGADDTNKQQNI